MMWLVHRRALSCIPHWSFQSYTAPPWFVYFRRVRGEEHTKKALLFVNNIDFEVVARDLIIALIAVIFPDEVQAVHCVLYTHLVFSTDQALWF